MGRRPMKDMSEVAELILKELRRRGGDKGLEVRIERAIHSARSRKKVAASQRPPGPRSANDGVRPKPPGGQPPPPR